MKSIFKHFWLSLYIETYFYLKKLNFIASRVEEVNNFDRTVCVSPIYYIGGGGGFTPLLNIILNFIFILLFPGESFIKFKKYKKKY